MYLTVLRDISTYSTLSVYLTDMLHTSTYSTLSVYLTVTGFFFFYISTCSTLSLYKSLFLCGVHSILCMCAFRTWVCFFFFVYPGVRPVSVPEHLAVYVQVSILCLYLSALLCPGVYPGSVSLCIGVYVQLLILFLYLSILMSMSRV